MLKKQEDNADSTAAAPGSISLDQAHALALHYAQEHREFYGRFSEQKFAWNTLGVQETEHDFEVRLSFRPVGNFRTAGVEQINIGKTGLIESRQIIRPPSLTHGFIAASIAIIIVTVAGSIFGGLFATSIPDSTNVSQPLNATIPITPEAPVRLVSPDGEVSIDLSPNTVSSLSQLAYSALSVAEIPALPPSFTVTGIAFELTTETPLLKPITVTVMLSDTDAALAAGNEKNIVIQHYTGGAWTQLATAVDFEASTATAQVDGLSVFVLTILEPGPPPIPAPPALPAAGVEPTLTPTSIPAPAAAPTSTPAPLPTATRLPFPTLSAVPVPAAEPIPLATATPVTPATPVPAQEWQLEDVLVVGDNVTVLIRILGPGWFNVTLDGIPTDDTIIDGSLRAEIFRKVPPGSHIVRVFTVGVPGQEDFRRLHVLPPESTATPTPTPSGPPTPTPIPTYRIFINGIAVPGLNRLLQTDAGSVTLSQAPKSDGAYKVGTEIVLSAASSPGFVISWGGVDSTRGAFATVELVADRYITVSMSAPTPTPEPTRTPFPWEIPKATPAPTPVPLPTPISVPTATGVLVSDAGSTPTPTAIPVPTATPTPLPPGAPTPTPTPTPVPTPTPTPGPSPTPTSSPTSTPAPTPTPTPTPIPIDFDDRAGPELVSATVDTQEITAGESVLFTFRGRDANQIFAMGAQYLTPDGIDFSLTCNWPDKDLWGLAFELECTKSQAFQVPGTWTFNYYVTRDAVPQTGQNKTEYYADGSIINFPIGGGTENLGTHSLNMPDIVVNP